MRPAAHYGFNNDSNNNGFAVGPTWLGQSTVAESVKDIYFHLYFNLLPFSLQLKHLLQSLVLHKIVNKPLEEQKRYFSPLIPLCLCIPLNHNVCRLHSSFFSCSCLTRPPRKYPPEYYTFSGMTTQMTQWQLTCIFQSINLTYSQN